MNVANEVAALSSSVFVAKDAAGDTWCGTRYWMVRDDIPVNPSVETIDKLVTGLDLLHELTWSKGPGGGHALVIPAGRDGTDEYARVYERSDGATVLLNVAYLAAVESLVLTTEPEFDVDEARASVVTPKLMQGDDPYGPVAVVTVGADNQDHVVGVVMPIRQS